jgi:tetratricopeptide (TPR) repeat protein
LRGRDPVTNGVVMIAKEVEMVPFWALAEDARRRSELARDGLEKAGALVEEARRLSDEGRYRTAIDLLDEAERCSPAAEGLWTARGWALENLDDDRLPKAKAAYRRALVVDPDDLHAREGLANVLERLGRVRASRRRYRQVVRRAARTGSDADVLELWGWCCYRLRRIDEAIATFERALSIDPDRASVHFDLGLSLLCNGAGPAAVERYRSGLATLEPGRRALGTIEVALDDLIQSLAERPDLAVSEEADTIEGLLRDAVPATESDDPDPFHPLASGADKHGAR